MKTILSISFIITFLFGSKVLGQVSPGTSCATAGCSTGGSYSSATSVPSMGSYSCLGSTPNANWLAIGIANTGSVHLVLTQTSNAGTPIDVDFALYGPYTSVSAGCPIGPATPTVDCSYSGSATEYIDITNAVVGQVYILLVTNFNGSAGTISIQPNAGQPSTGGINCAINFSATTTSTPATCNQPTGSVSATPVGGYAPYTYSWNIPGNPTTQTVNNVAPGTYTVTVTSSPNPTTGQTVNPTTATVTVGNTNPTYFGSATPASCSNGANGTATANFNVASYPGVTATFQWNDPAGQTTQTATGLLPGPYTCTLTLSNGCVGTVNVNVGSNSVTYAGTTTIVNCAGDATGSATATMTPVVGNLSYAWNDVNGQTSQTATNLTAGSYSCVITSDVGCTGTVNVVVTEIPAMTAIFPVRQDVTCNSGNDGVLVVQASGGTPQYNYSWDNSNSVLPGANDLAAGTHTVTITDANNCVLTATETISEPAPLAINFISPDIVLCPEFDTVLTVTGTGGSSAYTFTWTENGIEIGTGSSITVDPSVAVTNYCVTLSEVCGSPTTDTCMTINFPTPIVPSYAPDKPWSCEPGTFVFTNTSSNIGEIGSVLLSYGDTNEELIQGANSATHIYPSPGVYDLFATVTSVYGCTYTANMPAIVTVIANPTAEFNMSANPTTIFETTVTMQDKSSSGVVNWQWYSPGSVPSTSTSKNPTFSFPDGIVGNYSVQLIVETAEGCIDTIERVLFVNSDILFFAPNAFTPDGDEFNQVWKFEVSGVDEYNFELLIFNRWGQIIWETHDVNSSWDGTYDGKVVPFGAYSWVARVKDIYSDKKKEFNGAVNVLR